MGNNDKSFDELIEETKKLIKAFVDLTLKLIDPIVKNLMWAIEDFKKIFKHLFNDKKNKKNNKRLHRIKRNLLRR